MRTLPTGPDCAGASRPSQAANSRPDLNAAGSPIAATKAVAPSKPTPGISATLRLSGVVPMPQLQAALDTAKPPRRDGPRAPIALAGASTTIVGNRSETRPRACGHASAAYPPGLAA